MLLLLKLCNRANRLGLSHQLPWSLPLH
uniref:ATP binding protein n=1 Tax=Rhizophora mucronata TaxID=61149 RepID=A0A2P2MWH7_RHIMU